ncbi:hypothetical protein FGIG_10817 [Fasciola gigantica]|uniref:Uncharacterized protein n=1 Tax=Fasciola gigantica TaxID=46835 RepID=A0A504YHW3_FASGI|nr:hypothetical protein FGIG_10817 [Fasciola gigantica]
MVLWVRETLRMLCYIGVPCAAFTLANLPFFIERSVSSERVALHERFGVDYRPDDPLSVDEARRRYVNKYRFPSLRFSSEANAEESDETSPK